MIIKKLMNNLLARFATIFCAFLIRLKKNKKQIFEILIIKIYKCSGRNVNNKYLYSISISIIKIITWIKLFHFKISNILSDFFPQT